MANLQKLVDELSSLTVVEAADLAKILEGKMVGDVDGDRGARLFDDRQRTRSEPLRRGESLFDFYDSCARPGYDEFRCVVNGWLEQLPTHDDREKLISRMRYGGDREFGSSLAELSIHALVLGSGCDARPHPEVPGSTKRPDYLATDPAGEPLAYVEVTSVNPSDAQRAEENRENALYKAIDGAKIPAGSALGYKIRRFEEDDGRWTLREGAQFADLVALPDPWPPIEERR
jgi:hypothetical protein